jgi:hypothetical protein
MLGFREKLLRVHSPPWRAGYHGLVKYAPIDSPHLAVSFLNFAFVVLCMVDFHIYRLKPTRHDISLFASPRHRRMSGLLSFAKLKGIDQFDALLSNFGQFLIGHTN